MIRYEEMILDGIDTETSVDFAMKGWNCQRDKTSFVCNKDDKVLYANLNRYTSMRTKQQMAMLLR